MRVGTWMRVHGMCMLLVCCVFLALGSRVGEPPSPPSPHRCAPCTTLCVRRYVTQPLPLKRLFKDRVLVRQIAVGSQHCIALTPIGVLSWGVGDGGRLGHGDSDHRWTPALIEAFNDMIVIQVAAGAWHSAAIVQVPPHSTGGWVRRFIQRVLCGAVLCCAVLRCVELCCVVLCCVVLCCVSPCARSHCRWLWLVCVLQVYTWGAGYSGQLGQRGRSVNPFPGVVPGFVERNVTVTYVAALGADVCLVATCCTPFDGGGGGEAHTYAHNCCCFRCCCGSLSTFSATSRVARTTTLLSPPTATA